MRDFIAEFIATFSLVFIGAGSVLAGADLVGVALAHGLVLMTMVYATAHISGGHVNPAVTIAMWLSRKINNVKAIGYIISQLAGGVLAAYLLKLIFTAENLVAGVPILKEGLSVGNGVLLEAVLTFFLVFVIFGVAVDKRAAKNIYGVAIGLVLTFDILAGGNITGAAMNPARAFGPALVSGVWKNHLVYWIGPLIGAVVAGAIYFRLLLKEEKGKEGKEEGSEKQQPTLEEWKSSVKGDDKEE